MSCVSGLGTAVLVPSCLSIPLLVLSGTEMAPFRPCAKNPSVPVAILNKFSGRLGPTPQFFVPKVMCGQPCHGDELIMQPQLKATKGAL